jgi:IclR family transcriptional regulator, pca regulon regulatory protein
MVQEANGQQASMIVIIWQATPGPAREAMMWDEPGSEEHAADGDFVQSLERGLSVILAFDADHARLSLSEVAAATGLSRAAARRFLHTLVHLGYMHNNDGRFSLRPKILDLGYAYLSSLTLPEVAMPHMEELVEEVRESSSVSELDGEDVVYLARVPTKRIMTMTISVGTRFPAYATSMGRVLLAGLTPAELDAYLERVSMRPITARTITDPGALRAELDKVREQGWALVDQELEEGLRSLAAPIRDRSGRVTAAANIATHAARTSSADARRSLLPVLLRTVEQIGADLRAAGPPGPSLMRLR